MRSRTMRRGLPVVVTLFLTTACAHAPKPRELLDLAALREGHEYGVAQEKYPDLVKQSDEAYFKSVEAWKDEELELAKHYAILGTIRLRTAITMVREEMLQGKVNDARKELAELKKKEADLKRQLADVEEQIALHTRLAEARKAAEEKEAQLKERLTEAQRREEEQKRLAEAQSKVAEAALALKQADTVEASKYAQSEYETALSLLQRAEAALKEGKAVEASTMADAAKSRAEAAAAAARPQYTTARKEAERRARNLALQKDAAAIAGVTVRMKTVGETQQLILPITDLFRKAETTPRPDKKALLNEIAALLKRYEEYPIIINGYTSTRVRPNQQYAVSQARAQEVANYFVSAGIEFKRMAIAGRGTEELVAPKTSSLNDRVEVILLFR